MWNCESSQHHRKDLTVKQRRLERQLLLFHVIPLKNDNGRGGVIAEPSHCPRKPDKVENANASAKQCLQGWSRNGEEGWIKLLSDPPYEVTTKSRNEEQFLCNRHSRSRRSWLNSKGTLQSQKVVQKQKPDRNVFLKATKQLFCHHVKSSNYKTWANFRFHLNGRALQVVIGQGVAALNWEI